MQSIRKTLWKPKVDDWSPLAKFYHADENLNCVAAELDSFDGRRDPDRCNQLVSKMRQAQDKVLQIIEEMLCQVFTEESQRAPRDYRVKFPDDILHDNLPGQLWFGAECLAGGSNIIDHEFESEAIRPLARSLIRHLEKLRDMLKDQSLKDPTVYPDKLKKNLRIFDYLFAEFELNYVSAMVPVKSVREYDSQLDVTVLFSETLIRAVNLGYISRTQVEDCDPSVMITLPRLAIVCGLNVFCDGPLNIDKKPETLTEMFRPFINLLSKIRDLLRVLSTDEMVMLERTLCSQDEPTFDHTVKLIADTNKGDTETSGMHVKPYKVKSTVVVGSPSSVDDTPTSPDAVSTSSNASDDSNEQTSALCDVVDVPSPDSDSVNEETDQPVKNESTNKEPMNNSDVPLSSEQIARISLRSRFRSPQDMIHRLFVCVSGVADQLQTNYPADLRAVLKMVLQPTHVERVYEVNGCTSQAPAPEEETGVEAGESPVMEQREGGPLGAAPLVGVPWVPDSDCPTCTACEGIFTLVRRRHHCRNCGKIFCGRCSSNLCPLPDLGYPKAVRVCNQCFMFKLNPFTRTQQIQGQ